MGMSMPNVKCKFIWCIIIKELLNHWERTLVAGFGSILVLLNVMVRFVFFAVNEK